MELLTKTMKEIQEVDERAAADAALRLDSLTKPPGSLGVLEKIAIQLASIQGKAMPTLGKKVVMVMAGDHGVVEEGVSAFPQEVTPQMVLNFLNKGAAINVLSKHVGAEVIVTDVGVAAEIPGHPQLNNKKVRMGTRNMAKEPAMTEAETVAAVEVGIELVNKAVDEGASLIATGEMGIGNTTPSSAILACFSGKNIELVTGRGTGVDDKGLVNKQQVIQKALEVNNPDPLKPLDVLQKVGGLEIAALTGVILGAASRKAPVVIDGFISTAAALVAYKLEPRSRSYMFASHLSQEPGHKVMLEMIGLQPMLYLDLRLGEGTGAALAFNLLDASVKIIHEMATFEEAGVSNKE
ncbi:MAG: nicotinate-nucleotide--dimethylbenzimidazole phosphoribosyltransferase [Bacillota bacterium]